MLGKCSKVELHSLHSFGYPELAMETRLTSAFLCPGTTGVVCVTAPSLALAF